MKITENFTHLIRDIYLLSFKDILQYLEKLIYIYYMKKKQKFSHHLRICELSHNSQGKSFQNLKWKSPNFPRKAISTKL